MEKETRAKRGDRGKAQELPYIAGGETGFGGHRCERTRVHQDTSGTRWEQGHREKSRAWGNFCARGTVGASYWRSNFSGIDLKDVTSKLCVSWKNRRQPR